MENVDANTLVIMGMFITIIIGLAAILKHQFNMNDRVTKLEIEMKNEIIDFKMTTNERFTSLEKNMNERFIRIESKLELSSKDYVYTNKRVDDVIERTGDTNKILTQIDTNYQNLISKIIDKIDTSKTMEIPKTVIN